MWRLLTWLHSFAPRTALQRAIIDHLLEDRTLIDEGSLHWPPDHDGVPAVAITVGDANAIIAWLLQRPRRILDVETQSP